MIRRSLERVAKGEHGQIGVSSARMRQADRHLPLDVLAIETRKYLQLLELVRTPAEAAVQIRELVAGGNEARGQGNRFFQRLFRVGVPPLLAQAQPEQVVRVGGAVVEPDGLRQRRQRAVDVSVAVAGERQLEAHERRAIVELQAAFVGLARASKSLQLVHHVAQLVEWTRGRRVERGGHAEIAGGGLEIATALIGFAAPQMRQHRIGAQRDRAAEGFNRTKRLLVAERRVAAREERAIVPIPRGRLVGDRPGDAGDREHDHHRNRTFHTFYPNSCAPGDRGRLRSQAC